MINDEPTIRTSNLTTGYKLKREKIIVTNRLDATLHKGELVSLLGPNGAGKSTLLRTLAGFQPPLQGDILIMGKPFASYSSEEIAKTMSVVLTEKTSIENMDVTALISLGRTPYTDFWGRLKNEDKDAIEKAITLIGIDSLRHRQVGTLSDGERQKVMIAKAIAQETPIIFLDEPTAFLDYPSKVEIMLLLRSLAHNLEKTIFLSTHDIDISLQTSDKIWLIDKTLGVRIGTWPQLAESRNLERYFQRPGIYFDYTTGLFKIDSTYNEKIFS